MGKHIRKYWIYICAILAIVSIYGLTGVGPKDAVKALKDEGYRNIEVKLTLSKYQVDIRMAPRSQDFTAIDRMGRKVYGRVTSGYIGNGF